jgi:glycosyltransferase involved in cell wall biosynthesis
MSSLRFAVIIPAYNEESHVGDIVKKALEYTRTVIVVDDGSSDKTSRTADNSGAIVVRHSVNLGKGAALKTGCELAFSLGAEKIIFMDADGQHNAKNISKFIELLEKYDVVIGYRSLNFKMPLVFRLGNWMMATATRFLYNIDLKDTQCGFRAFNKRVYKKISWESLDYSVESEIIANIGKHNLKYTAVPIETIYKDNYKGTTIFDGMMILANMVKWKLIR